VHRPAPIELVEDQPHDASDLFVRVERHLARRVLEVAEGDGRDQLAPLRLVQLALVHPRLQDVKLRLGHHAAQAQQETIRMVRRVVHPVGIRQQHAEAAAQLQQLVPVLARAGQAAHLQAEDQPHPIQGDLGQQALEAGSAFDGLATLAEVGVDGGDAVAGPPQGHRAIRQGVLAGGRFLVVEHLLRRRLADVHDRLAVEVPRLHFGRGREATRGGVHDAPPAARPRRSGSVGRVVRRAAGAGSAAVRVGVAPRSPAEEPPAGDGGAGGVSLGSGSDMDRLRGRDVDRTTRPTRTGPPGRW